MVYRRAILTTSLLIGMGTTIWGQAGVGNTQIVDGTCTSQSNIAEGPLGTDLTKRQSRFYCDTAAITFFDDSPGHVLINFSEKKAQHSQVLGFAGQIEPSHPGDTGTMMRVSNVYLSTGQASPVSDGWCKLFSKEEQLSEIGCGMKVDEGGRRTVAIVTFDAAPDHSSQTVAPSDTPIETKTETLADGTKVITFPNGNKLETLTDATVWAITNPNNEMLAAQLDPTTMPSSSDFHTVIIVNLPKSDIYGAPKSERIQIEGGCQSRTYQILGELPYSGENGGGLPEAELATQPEGVIREVESGTLIWNVFDLICKKP